jgi:PAS domain S-box-containing protein
VQTAQVIVLVLDRTGRIVHFNPFLEELLGCSLAQVQGQDGFSTFFAQHDQPAMRDLFDQALTGNMVEGRLCPAQARSAGPCDIDWRVRALRGPHQTVMGVLFIGHDVTDLKQAQVRSLQAERLAAVGAMVTMLNHESRSALQENQACLEMLRWQLEGQAKALALVDRLQQQQDRLHRLHEDLRGYAAPLQLQWCVCDLAQIWRQAWSDRVSLRPGLQAVLQEEHGEEDLHCPVDRFRLEQVFRNLLDNSLDACSPPAQITIGCSATTLRGQPALQIAVRDNGPGLTAVQRLRLFEPFFTTKKQGTGLGLAISQRIVEAHGGRIAVGNGAGPGTEIVITLPRGSHEPTVAHPDR